MFKKNEKIIFVSIEKQKIESLTFFKMKNKNNPHKKNTKKAHNIGTLDLVTRTRIRIQRSSSSAHNQHSPTYNRELTASSYTFSLTSSSNSNYQQEKVDVGCSNSRNIIRLPGNVPTPSGLYTRDATAGLRVVDSGRDVGMRDSTGGFENGSMMEFM